LKAFYVLDVQGKQKIVKAVNEVDWRSARTKSTASLEKAAAAKPPC
jgi:hypothetical protein